MICKECGAYNPDHASYCKVCAANLKENSQNKSTASEPEERYPSMDDSRPARGFVRPPVWSASQNNNSKRSTPVEVKDEEAAIDEVVDDVVDDAADEVSDSAEPIEEVKVKPQPPVVPKKPVILEDDEDDGDEEDDDDESILFAPASQTKSVNEPEPATTKWSPKEVRRQQRNHVDEYRKIADKESESEEDDEQDDYEDYDDYDEYEYVPTPPKHGARKSKKKGGSKLFWILLSALLLVVLVAAAFCIYLAASGQAEKIPLIGQSCAGTADGGNTPTDSTDPNTSISPDDSAEPTVAPETQADNSNIVLTEISNDDGTECISFTVILQPGDTLTLTFSNQEPQVISNTDAAPRSLNLVIPKSCYYPNTPLDSETYTVVPEGIIVSSSNVETVLDIPSFDLTFPALSLSLTTPTEVPAEGIMASEGNIIHIEGSAGEHTVTLYVNDVQQTVYEGGMFSLDYQLSSETEAETVVIRAEQNNYVTAETEFVVTPYVFVPDPMVLTVVQGVEALRATGTNKVTVTGTTVPGATLAAVTDNTDAANCGSVSVDASGNFTFDVTFNNDYYGFVNVTINAVKEGHEDGTATCVVTRMFDERSDFINYGEEYLEIPKPDTMATLLENADKTDWAIRLIGTVAEIIEQDGYTIARITVTSEGTEYSVYVMNQSLKWKPADNVGNRYKLYCSPNGLFGDTTDLYVVAWFALAD